MYNGSPTREAFVVEMCRWLIAVQEQRLLPAAERFGAIRSSGKTMSSLVDPEISMERKSEFRRRPHAKVVLEKDSSTHLDTYTCA